MSNPLVQKKKDPLSFKVSEYPFNQNKAMLKNMKVVLYTYFYQPFSIYIIYLSHALLNIGKITVKVGPKTNCFSCFTSSCTNRIAVLKNLLALMCSQPRDKQNRARNFLLYKYFLNNVLLTVFMQNALLKFVELL